MSLSYVTTGGPAAAVGYVTVHTPDAFLELRVIAPHTPPLLHLPHFGKFILISFKSLGPTHFHPFKIYNIHCFGGFIRQGPQ